MEDCDLVSDSTFTVTLLNTSSFRKHAIDIVHDNILMDIICLTETQLIRILAAFQNYLLTLRFAII